MMIQDKLALTWMVTITEKSDSSLYSEKFANDCKRTNLPFSNRIMSLYFVGWTIRNKKL